MNAWQLGEWVVLRPLWLLPALLLLIGSVLWRQTSSHSHWRNVLSPAVFRYLGAEQPRATRWYLPLLLAALISVSLSQPVLRQSDDDTWRHSIGWVAVADVSRSMTLNDTVPSRLAAMREAMAELSRQAAARPIALILFSGDAFLVAPPAFDRSVFNEHTALLEHGIIPVEGSNLTRALSLAGAVIEDSQFRQARVFVLGDSGGVGKSSIAAARFLGDAGHRVDMLIFGSSTPQPESADPVNASIDMDESAGASAGASSGESAGAAWSQALGARDETSVDWQQVQTLARAGQGQAVRANSFGVIDYAPLALDRQATASTHSELKSLVWREQSHWLLLLAIPLMLLLFHRESAH